MKKSVFKNVAKFTGKRLRQSLFFSKLAGVSLYSYYKKRRWHKFFPVNFAKFLITPFFTEHIRTHQNTSASKVNVMV